MKHLGTIGAVACVAVIAFGSLPGKVAPKPKVPTVAACFTDLKARVHATWAEGSSMAFKTDTEAQKWVNERVLAEFKTAFTPVRQREQDALGKEYDDAKRQALWTQFAKESE